MSARVRAHTGAGGVATVSISPGASSALARSLSGQAVKKIRKQLEEIGEEGRLDAEARLSKLYQPRPGDRRNKDTAGVPLHGSIRSKVDDNSGRGFPLRVLLYSEADPRKVHSLNSGARAHVITPKNTKWLKFPGSDPRTVGFGRSGAIRMSPYGGRQGDARDRQRFFANRNAGSYLDAASVKARKVNHPGIRPSYFLELALERAWERATRRQVRLERR